MAEHSSTQKRGKGPRDTEKPGLSARAAAVGLLDAVLGEGQLLSQAEPLLAGLPGAERARAQRLATQVLRQCSLADQVLKPFLNKTPPLHVLNVLRLATVELAAGEAAHGVVNEAVNLVRRHPRHQALGAFVNAVLRRVSQIGTPFAGAGCQVLPPWLRRRLITAWGKPAVQAIEAVQALMPPIDLTLHPGRQSGPTLPGEMLPTGSLRLTPGVQISALDGFDTGDWWVQDAAAALAARLLAVAPGEAVLDLCAAPGGKTMQLAAAGARVTALDISGARLERLRENLGRTGLEAEIVVADALVWQPGQQFDAILLDAPCSATGTIRRHPDLPFVRDGSEIAALTQLQAQMIDRALGWLRPGGRLVYCTCSLLPDEGEAQIAAALARHPGLRVEPANLPGIGPHWLTEAGGLRLRPDYWAEKGGMDGFFMARLLR